MAGFTIFVKVQTICALARTFVAGMVSIVPASVPKALAGFPELAALLSTQLAEVIVKFVATVSVMVTFAPVVVTKTGVVTVG